MRERILERLKTECPFPEVFEDIEYVKPISSKAPRWKIGRIRADHDGHRWWNTVWPCHSGLAAKEAAAEIDRLYDALTILQNHFWGPREIRRFRGESRRK